MQYLFQTYNVDKLKTMHTYGRPSDDTHCLRNDSAADSDKPLETHNVASPPLYDSDDGKCVLNVILRQTTGDTSCSISIRYMTVMTVSVL